MLNYLLDKIAGPKCIELKVQNPEKFSFKPKELLSLTSDIFLKLSAHAAFAPAVIRDGRSYNPQVLRKVVRLLSTHGLQDQAWLERLNGVPTFSLAPLPRRPPPPTPFSRYKPDADPASTEYKLDADPASTEHKSDVDPARTAHLLHRFLDPPRSAGSLRLNASSVSALWPCPPRPHPFPNTFTS
jgi:hypothetical protein